MLEAEAEAEDKSSRPRPRPRPKIWPRGQLVLEDLTSLVHCNLVIMLILGANRNKRYNKMSVVMKCTYWMA